MKSILVPISIVLLFMACDNSFNNEISISDAESSTSGFCEPKKIVAQQSSQTNTYCAQWILNQIDLFCTWPTYADLDFMSSGYFVGRVHSVNSPAGTQTECFTINDLPAYGTYKISLNGVIPTTDSNYNSFNVNTGNIVTNIVDLKAKVVGSGQPYVDISSLTIDQGDEISFFAKANQFNGTDVFNYKIRTLYVNQNKLILDDKNYSTASKLNTGEYGTHLFPVRNAIFIDPTYTALIQVLHNGQVIKEYSKTIAKP